jgi:ribonuclease P protein component
MPEKRDESFSKENRLRKSTEFRRVFSRGKRTATPYFVVYSIPNRLSFPRLGIQVRAKIGPAAKRNYIKRMVRETFRKMKTEFHQPADIVFIAEKEIVQLKSSEFQQHFRKVVARFLR